MLDVNFGARRLKERLMGIFKEDRSAFEFSRIILITSRILNDKFNNRFLRGRTRRMTNGRGIELKNRHRSETRLVTTLSPLPLELILRKFRSNSLDPVAELNQLARGGEVKFKLNRKTIKPSNLRLAPNPSASRDIFISAKTRGTIKTIPKQQRG